ncbi:MAG: Asp-tRNA(Asn)/Glu-tRNA(Gln) amidotransferase subunit GatC [Acidimicrobiia bacterium]|nr:Asp-tRNA(Asn)/Glu-tRNA(Gln) amidotransferase subunit GatC [Acidimicrobiia bacterium]
MNTGADPQIDIVHVARLARLDLDPEQLEHYGAQLQDIVAYAADVQAIDTEGLPEMSHPMGMDNSLRDDVVVASLDRERVLDNAPATEDGFLVVPPSLGEDEGDEGTGK